MSNLGLNQHQTGLQRREVLEEVQEHRNRDVVRQVGDQGIWVCRKFGDLQSIVANQSEVRSRSALGNGRFKFGRHLRVNLNRDYLFGNLEKTKG